ncbi:hypothetical protein [Streptomyces sp. NPDC058279]|uniref:hypothetical protein n=1 Tax=Streptomyces sp. NPDC058279 TaxID=3346418 RepID=UPI0036E2FFC4
MTAMQAEPLYAALLFPELLQPTLYRAHRYPAPPLTALMRRRAAWALAVVRGRVRPVR